MLVRAQAMKAAATRAIRTDPEADLRELATAAHVAQFYCSEGLAEIASAAVQLHGGIGFTWELGIQLYYKRAQASRQLLGSPDDHLAELAELGGITPPARDPVAG